MKNMWLLGNSCNYCMVAMENQSNVQCFGMAPRHAQCGLNEEVGFKIPTTRTCNDSLFCCVLLRGTARWSTCVGRSSGPRGS